MEAENEVPEEGAEEQPKKIEWENLTDEMATEAQEIFDECFDKEGNGWIETSELRKFLMWVNYNPTTRECQSYIKEFDPNNSKHITRANCMKLVDRRAGNPDSYEELYESLKQFDKNGNGKIDVPEFRLILASFGEKMDEGIVDDVIKELDQDG